MLMLLAAACGPPAARPVEARFAAAPGQETATLVIQFTGDVTNAYVAVNGEEVARAGRTRRIVVRDIPAGEVAVMLAAEGGVEKAFGVHLEAGQHMVVPVATPAPPAKTLHPVVQAALALFVYLTYAGVSSLF
jgi:hypothetical protein